MILWWNMSGNEVLLTHQFAEYLYVIFSNTNSQDGVLIDPVLHLEPHLWKLHLFWLSVFFSQSELEAQIPRHLGAKIPLPISQPNNPIKDCNGHSSRCELVFYWLPCYYVQCQWNSEFLLSSHVVYFCLFCCCSSLSPQSPNHQFHKAGPPLNAQPTLPSQQQFLLHDPPQKPKLTPLYPLAPWSTWRPSPSSSSPHLVLKLQVCWSSFTPRCLTPGKYFQIIQDNQVFYSK